MTDFNDEALSLLREIHNKQKLHIELQEKFIEVNVDRMKVEKELLNEALDLGIKLKAAQPLRTDYLESFLLLVIVIAVLFYLFFWRN